MSGGILADPTDSVKLPSDGVDRLKERLVQGVILVVGLDRARVRRDVVLAANGRGLDADRVAVDNHLHVRPAVVRPE